MRVAKSLMVVSIGIGALAVGLPLGQMAYADGGGTPSSLPGAMPTKDLSGFANTYWYVPTEYLTSYQYSDQPSPNVMEVPDQTVWHFTSADKGFLHGCSFRSLDLGKSWTPATIVGSIAPNNQVLIGFYGQLLETSPGTLVQSGKRTYFLMQVSTGPIEEGNTHWAYMAQVTPRDPAWTNLPGTSVPGTKGQGIPAVDTGC